MVGEEERKSQGKGKKRKRAMFHVYNIQLFSSASPQTRSASCKLHVPITLIKLSSLCGVCVCLFLLRAEFQVLDLKKFHGDNKDMNHSESLQFSSSLHL